MSGRYLLDTSVLIALFADDPSVKKGLGQADEVFIPSIAIGELYYGAWRSRHRQEHTARIDALVGESVVLACSEQTARRCGEIKNALRVKGRPIPENDIWIAAIALQHVLTLVARDAHFSEIPTLTVEVW